MAVQQDLKQSEVKPHQVWDEQTHHKIILEAFLKEAKLIK